LSRFGKQVSAAKNSSFFPDLKPTVKMSEADELSADLVDHLGTDLWSLPPGKLFHLRPKLEEEKKFCVYNYHIDFFYLLPLILYYETEIFKIQEIKMLQKYFELV
jgi:hypothetical protein